MASLYTRPDIYDFLDSPARDEAILRHWKTILEGANIETLLDVSIGSGGMTLPLAKTGVKISGSDLSQQMLDKCRENAARKGVEVSLTRSDFRDIDIAFDEKFDCVASTGNSLPYVSNSDLLFTLGRMDALVRDGGYIYIDTRNWDVILRDKPRFYTYNPTFKDDVRTDMVQAWDYMSDGTIVFNMLYTFERDGKRFDKAEFAEIYHPVPRELIINRLKQLGYNEIKLTPFPAWADVDAEECEWYAVLAKK